MSYQTLAVSHDDHGCLTVELNRPDIRNAFNPQMIQELSDVFHKEASESQVKMVLLRGKGKVFCAGGDLNWMKKSIDYNLDQNLEDTLKLSEMFQFLNEFPKPVIGCVHGAAIGGGVGLVSVCDIVFAHEKTVFSLAEVRLGVVPACIGPFVIAKVGASHARRLFVGAERFDAVKAKEIGLVHEVLSSETDLNEKINQLILGLSQCGPNAVAVAKRLVLDLSWPEKRTQMEDPIRYVSETLASVRVSPEGQEGVKAFLEKRKPSWIEN